MSEYLSSNSLFHSYRGDGTGYGRTGGVRTGHVLCLKTRGRLGPDLTENNIFACASLMLQRRSGDYEVPEISHRVRCWRT